MHEKIPVKKAVFRLAHRDLLTVTLFAGIEPAPIYHFLPVLSRLRYITFLPVLSRPRYITFLPALSRLQYLSGCPVIQPETPGLFSSRLGSLFCSLLCGYSLCMQLIYGKDLGLRICHQADMLVLRDIKI